MNSLQVTTKVNGETFAGTLEPVKPAKPSLIARIHAIPNGSTANGKPLAVVNTRNGKRGVFWKGIGKTGEPTVGVRKITKGGRVYNRRARFNGTRWIAIDDLAAEGNS